MISHITVNYSDIYQGQRPTKENLLSGINSRVVILLMAMINSELHEETDDAKTQLRITNYVTSNFPSHEKAILSMGLKRFRDKVGHSPIAIWSKRYVLEFMKYEFMHYKEGESIDTRPEEEVNIFKAYLQVAQELNERDRSELKKATEAIVPDDEHRYEKLVWPFLLRQFDTNNRVNPIFQFFKLFALIKYSISDSEVYQAWKKFIKLNGFDTLKEYLASVHTLINITQSRHLDKDLKVFSWIKASQIPPHLLNLSFDRKRFLEDPQKRIDYKGFRERPLFRYNDNEFVILDIDFLNNKVYNGPLFDLYNETNMSTTTRFKEFHDFKTHIGSHVSENIIFKGIIQKLFGKKHTILHFDEKQMDGYPDCYIRSGNKVFLIEFKDYLFPGKLVETYSFEKIKSHIDLKFIKNENGKNKGISQIIEQLQILSATGFDFDKFVPDKKTTIHPIIIHTNFTYQMPGINHYLNREFKRKANSELPNIEFTIKDLVLIDLETCLEFFQLHEMNLNKFEAFLMRYGQVLANREKRFLTQVNKDNFVRARSSFDEIFRAIFQPKIKSIGKGLQISILLDSIGADDKMLNSF